MKFTDWVSWPETTAAPALPGIFQVKIRTGLITYPAGKSAMFYYGFASPLDTGLQTFRARILPELGKDEETLVVRWLTPPETKDRFKQYLDKFYINFGSLPAGNEIQLNLGVQTTK